MLACCSFNTCTYSQLTTNWHSPKRSFLKLQCGCTSFNLHAHLRACIAFYLSCCPCRSEQKDYLAQESVSILLSCLCNEKCAPIFYGFIAYKAVPKIRLWERFLLLIADREEPTGISLCDALQTHTRSSANFNFPLLYLYVIPGWACWWGNLLGTRERFGSKIWRFNQDFNFSSLVVYRGHIFCVPQKYVQKGTPSIYISLHSPALHVFDYLLYLLSPILKEIQWRLHYFWKYIDPMVLGWYFGWKINIGIEL